MIEVLSLGAGVQSTTVLLMSLEGLLPKLDWIVFADTQWEPKAVYEHLERLQTVVAIRLGLWDGECMAPRPPIHVVTAGDLQENELTGSMRGKVADGSHAMMLPYFTHGQSSDGMVRRQCTNHYKIKPIERFIRRTVLGLNKGQRAPTEKVVRLWKGISADEATRMTKDPDKFTTNYYPLVEKRLTRQDCLNWLAQRGWEVPRSACLACPFKHNQEWQRLRDESPDEWQKTVEFDQTIRSKGGERGELFVHADRVPLDEAHIDRDSPGQLLLWQDECTGMCGV